MIAPLLSIVVIGRNEGTRLARCFESILTADWPSADLELIYVDSDSRDGSPRVARSFGVEVIVLHPLRPTAALGRNAGWRRARGEFVFFLDGDTVLDPAFIRHALSVLEDRRIAVVWGHRRELAPHASVFNRVLDLDWIYPAGISDFCGGDAIMRRSALKQCGGFNESLIAGEEPELCSRLRSGGWQIAHIDHAMTGHDLAMHSFRQYWRRATRAGYAYREVSEVLKDTPTPLWAEAARHNRERAALLCSGFLSTIAASFLLQNLWPVFAAAVLFGLVAGRTAWKIRWKCDNPLTLILYSLHAHLQQIPIYVGQLQYRYDKRSTRKRGLIEYKTTP